MKHKSRLIKKLIADQIPFCIVAGDDLFGANYTLCTEKGDIAHHRQDMIHFSRKTRKWYCCYAMAGPEITELKRLISEKEMRLHYSEHLRNSPLSVMVYLPVNAPGLMGWHYETEFDRLNIPQL